ncbi:MAG: site-specific integrase [Pseudomonadota bacterium]
MANYLWKNRHGSYYFRVRIAVHHRCLFGERSELRLALHTTDKQSAKRNARALMVEYEKSIQLADSMKKKNPPPFFMGLKLVYETTAPTGEKLTRALEFTPQELQQIGPTAITELVGAMNGTTSSIDQPCLPYTPVPAEGHKTSAVLEDFIQKQAWSTPKSETLFRATLGLLITLVGDKKINEVSKEDAREIHSVLLKLPPNINARSSLNKGKPLRDVIEQNSGKVISPTTVKHHLNRLKTFFNWSIANYQEVTVNPFSGLKAKSPRGTVARDSFELVEIEKIFTCYIYNSGPWPKSKPAREASKFWIPLILAFTGCRLNEGCQLYVSDLRVEHGVWIFDFNDKHDDQQLKGTFTRKVPIHKKLLEFGLTDYLDEQTKKGATRLFPELKFADTGDGYGRSIGEFCRGVIKHLGIKKPLHSFRHSFSELLHQASVDRPKIQVLMGHTDSATIGKHYQGNNFTLGQLRIAINKLDFQAECFNQIHYKSFTERRRG